MKSIILKIPMELTKTIENFSKKRHCYYILTGHKKIIPIGIYSPKKYSFFLSLSKEFNILIFNENSIIKEIQIENIYDKKKIEINGEFFEIQILNETKEIKSYIDRKKFSFDN